PSRELPDLQERRAGIEQAPHPLARQELAAPEMPFARLGVSAERDQGDLLLEVVDQSSHALGVALEFSRARIELAFDRAHANPKSGQSLFFRVVPIYKKSVSFPFFHRFSGRLGPMPSRWMSPAPS